MEVNDDDFKEKVIEKSREMPVVVDFYADWCGPCHMLAPIMEKVEDEFEGKVVFVKINVDNSPKSSHEYGITGIPAVKLFKDGDVADEFVGLMPEDSIRKWLKKNL